MRLAVALMLSCAAGGSAAAQCPTRADLPGGILLTEEGEGAEFYRALSPEVVQGYVMQGASPILLGSYARGLYVLDTTDLVPPEGISGRIAYDYGTWPGALPDPAEGMHWEAEVTALEDGSPMLETHVYDIGALRDVAIGACHYDALPVRMRMAAVEEGGSDWLVLLNYLPELGISYLVAEGTSPEELMAFPKTGIVALRPTPAAVQR